MGIYVWLLCVVNFAILAAVCYQKFPHPISGVLQKLSVLDGVDEDRLLVFLELVLQLADFPGVSEGEVLSLIYPYCRGSLAGLVTNTLRRGGSVDAFHGEVLDFFIPHRRRAQLKFDLFYRLQANGEALGDFVHDVRKAARVLRLGLPETEFIQAILEGLNPQERSRLIFADRPRCFADLDRLCVVSSTVQAGDESRGRASTDVQYSSGLLGRAKKDKHGGWRRTQETVRKT